MKTYYTHHKKIVSVLLSFLTILGLNINSYANNAPIFNNGSATNRSVKENTDAGENIGHAVAATDADEDTLTYSLSGADSESFDIDENSGGLKTLEALDYETQQSYSVEVIVSDGNGGSDSIDVTIRVRDVVDLSTPLSERTSQIRKAIVQAIPGINTAGNVGDRHLLEIDGSLYILNKNIRSLVSGDFSGLVNLQFIELMDNSISSLPEDVFDGLSSLTMINLYSNSISSLPEDVFDGLSSLTMINLYNNSISSLPEDVFDGLSSLEKIKLGRNSISSLPEDVFDGLSSLEEINLGNNSISSLPEDVFDGLSSLEILILNNNSISSLPEDVFDGLSSLEEINLQTNSLTQLPEGLFHGLTSLSTLKLRPANIPVRLSLSKVDDGEFKATVHTAAPFDMTIPILGTNGSVDGGVSTITVSKGEMESDTLTVTRNSDTRGVVTIDIGRPLPRKPNSHAGYRLVRSGDLPLEVLPYNHSTPVFNEGSSTTRAVQENTAADENIGDAVSATSDDSNATLTYTLSGTDAESFAIESTTGQLKTSASLDYETKNTYSVTVIAKPDNAPDTFSTTIDVTINVTDVNEAPQFSEETTTRSVDENTAGGAYIGDPITATDPDTDASLTYTLGGTHASKFQIRRASGQLKTWASLDYETNNTYSVTVTATDEGSLSSIINVTINVTDVNEAPQFSEETTTRSVDENTARGAYIGDPITATDPDTDASLTYTLGGTHASKFRIVRASGQLKAWASLDYETNNTYSVTVTATDEGSLSSIINVTINVNDLFESTSLSNRTSEVIDAIIAALSDVSSADDVTDADLSTITSLNLSDKVSSLQNGDFSGLSALEVLNLDSNSLTTLPSNIFDGLSALTDLDLSSNSLSTLHSDIFNDLSALIDLDLSSNSLSTLHSTIFNDLSALTDLDLSSNSLSTLWWNVFRELSDLKNLDLSSNSLSTVHEDIFEKQSDLTDLDLSSNSFSTLPSDVFRKLSDLTDLDLSSNSFSTLHPDIFEKQSDLTDLDLSSNSLSTLPSDVFRELSDLTHLDLSSNSLSTLPSDVFRELSDLTHLDLSNNSFSSLPNNIFVGLTSLVNLNLSDNAADPVPITVELKESTDSNNSEGFKVSVKTGCPYRMRLTVRITNGTGSFTNGSYSSQGRLVGILFNIGERYSNHVAVTRDSGTTGAVTAEIQNFTTLAPTESGYNPVFDDTIELEIYPALNNNAAAPSNVQQIPDATEFLPNYPNPFNPETWIPYQLSTPADVTLTIYNMRGVVVRQLALGHQPAGYYTSRSRAAYWDGRNGFGEKVATGIYFCVLKAGDFSATRKMLILK